MSIEELVKQFVALASKPKLGKSELEEARQLMLELKKGGMTNEEISKLSKGKWTPSTVKFYTPGIKPTHPTPWSDVTSLLSELINVGFTLTDVETAVKVSESLKSHGTSLNDIIGLLFTIDSSSLEAADVIHQYELMKENGLSPEKLAEALSLREELEQMGLPVDSMVPLVELAKNYGEPEKIIEATSSYKSLVDLNQHIAAADSKLISLQEQLTNKQKEIESAEANLSKLDDLAAAYDKVKKLGFGVPELTKLSALGQKYGSMKKLMDAVDTYNNYSGILDKLNKTKADLTTWKSNLEKLQTDNAHLKTAVTMCQTLIDKYKFGLDALATIFSIAEKYGSPLDVLKAVEAYGQLEALNQQVAGKKGEAFQMKEEVTQLEGQRKQAQESLASLSALALEVGSQVGKVEGRAAGCNDFAKLLILIGNPYADYEDHIPTALVLALSLKKWVSKNEAKFKHYSEIKSGLERLFKELGGLE